MARTSMAVEIVSLLHPLGTGPRQQGSWPQVNRDLHLVHTLAGRGALRANGELHETNPQNVVAPPMGTLCTWDKACDGPWEMINVHYRVTWRGGQAIDDRWSLPTRFQPRNLSSIHAQLGRLVRAWRGDQPWGQLKVVSSLAKIISGYWSEHAHVVANERRDDLVEAARDWLDTHPLIAYDARGLARTIGLSVSQLNRRFRLAVGTSPKSYWQQQRLARCRIELRHSPRTLKSLATDLGFSDVYYFCRWFRQQTGTTPGTFRRGPLDPAL